MSLIGLGVSPDLIKAATSDEATDEDKNAFRDELRKVLGVEDVEPIKADNAELREKAASLEARLATVEQMEAPRNIHRQATQLQQTKATEAELLDAEAQRIKEKALTWTDPPTRAQYMEEANRLTAKAASVRSTL